MTRMLFLAVLLVAAMTTGFAAGVVLDPPTLQSSLYAADGDDWTWHPD